MLSKMLRSCAMKRIESWLNTRILELRQRIQDLNKPSNPVGERFRGYAIKRAEIELDHLLYFAGEDE